MDGSGVWIEHIKLMQCAQTMPRPIKTVETLCGKLMGYLTQKTHRYLFAILFVTKCHDLGI